MANRHGDFIWYELATPDPDASKAFYDDVVGWTVEAAPSGPIDYRMIAAADGLVGGVARLTPDMEAGGARPAWIGYVGVDDVDASVAGLEAAGGRTRMPATDLPGVGRLAMVADPDSAPFHVMRGASEGTSTVFTPHPTDIYGHVVWNELASADPDRALGFYGRAFGWRQDGAMPMGELGEYRFLRHGADMIGAVMPEVMGAKGWLFYFHVPDIDAAADRVRHAGGTVEQEPVELPGGGFSMTARDPHGARFGLVGGRMR